MIIRLSLVVVVRLCVPCDLYLFVERRKSGHVSVVGQGWHFVVALNIVVSWSIGVAG